MLFVFQIPKILSFLVHFIEDKNLSLENLQTTQTTFNPLPTRNIGSTTQLRSQRTTNTFWERFNRLGSPQRLFWKRNSSLHVWAKQ